MHKWLKQQTPPPQSFEQAFMLDIEDPRTLLRKEMAINESEGVLIRKRMRLMREFINDLPSTDPQYSMIAVAIEADQVELDELQRRARAIAQKIEEL